jgi:lipopolysaccharide transport system ATP-binding protein
MSTAIEFNHVGKQYRLGLVSTGTLSHDLNRWWQTAILRREDPYLKIGETNDRSTRGNSEYVWALKDINFKVEQGDVVGIIGKNGAGKSTLLKLLSRVTAPTTGTIRARGRIASLLEVGTGFHGEMTGRENIFLNGAILGYDEEFLKEKYDEILEFSELGDFINLAVKNYSSGMLSKLGFSIATIVDPDILILDEVLGVGDITFRKKSKEKLKSLMESNTTVLLVSHSIREIRSICDKAIWIEKGKVREIGEVNYICDKYTKEAKNASKEKTKKLKPQRF